MFGRANSDFDALVSVKLEMDQGAHAAVR